MTETSGYKEWLSSPYTSRGIIETAEVSHSSWGSLYLANWDAVVTCTVEDKPNSPVDIAFQNSRFILEDAEVGDSTQQSTSVSISAYDGQLYGQLKSMTPEDREEPILFTPRLYWTDDQTTQLINPAPVWIVHSVTLSLDAVRADIQASPLRVHRTGIYFTALEFPIMRFL